MIRKTWFTLFFLLLLNAVFSQTFKGIRPSNTIRLSVPGLFDILDANFTPGFEFWIDQQWSAGIDAGYIFASVYRGDAAQSSGLLLRPFIRHYFSKWQEAFFQLQPHFKYVKYEKEEWVDQQVVNGVPAFSRLDRVSYIKRAIGMHFLFGRRSNLGSSNHFFAEISGGLGYRYKWQDVPQNTRGQFRVVSFSNKEKLSTPVLLANFMVCYKL